MDRIFGFGGAMAARRVFVPKRTTELIALVALSTTVFLFIHTRDLHTKLRQMEGKLNPEDETALQTQDTSYGNPSTYPPPISPIASQSTQSSPVAQQHLGGLPRGGRAVFSASATGNEVPGSSSSSGTSGNTAVAVPASTPVESAWALNNTARAALDIVFFNRVPKVGSQTFMELLHRLSLRNGFAFRRDRIQRVETIRLSPEDELRLAAMVSTLRPPSVYIKHVCFTNFTKFGLPEPIYVNLVRDPVERVISWYYYVRAPWYYVERKQAFPDIPLPDPMWLKKDFETCVLRGDRECKYITGEMREGIGDHRRQSLFFCGHSEDCTPFNTESAVQKAKWSVERHYAVVGVLEDLNTTLQVLESYVPRYFAGARQVFRDEVSRFAQINRNPFKPPVREEVKQIVRRNFTRETDFYEFCRQRLHRQLAALNLKGA